ncbi:MAG: hypothetical protein ACI9JN_002076 [Bacteroidia bacterium]|jgi:hypothetical protein
MSAQNVLHNISTNNADTLSKFDLLAIDSNQRFGFRINFAENVIRIVQSDVSVTLFQSAWACEETFDMGVLNADIRDVSITTNHDFDSTHTEGLDMEQYFMLDFPNPKDGIKQSFTEMVRGMNSRLNNQAFYPSSSYSPVFYLLETPVLSDTISFSLSIQFEDGSLIRATTDDIIVQ